MGCAGATNRNPTTVARPLSLHSVNAIIRDAYAPAMLDALVPEITGTSLFARERAPRGFALGPPPDWTTALCEGTEGWEGSTWRYDAADREDFLPGIMRARQREREHLADALRWLAAEWGFELDGLY